VKINFAQLVTAILSFLLGFALFMLMISLSACSSSYHLSKFYKKGGKIEPVERVVTMSDTIQINGKDSIIYREVNIDCPEPIAPPTRFEIRYKYKTLRDTLELIRYQTKVEYKYRTREAKNDLKTNPLRQIKGMIFWAVLIVIGLFVYNWISKK